MRNLRIMQGAVMVGILVGVFVGNSTPAHAVKPVPQGKQAGKFVVLGTGDVLDTTTGLRWQQTPGVPGNTVSNCDNGNPCLWQEAVDYCVAMGAGYRLAEVDELKSVVDYSVPTPGPSISPGHPFINVQSGFYWTGTTWANNPLLAWYVNFEEGIIRGSLKTNPHLTWCVR